jgi:hypothetical protein
MKEQTSQRSVGPRWSQGQRWKVEYLRFEPSTAKAANPNPPAPRRSIWNYEVVRASTANGILISLQDDTGDRKYEMTLGAEHLNLEKVHRVDGSNRDQIIDASLSKVFFGWSMLHPVIFDWPAFPSDARRSKTEISTLDETPVEQTIEPKNGSDIEIIMSQMRVLDERSGDVRIVKQFWQAGLPWWSSASVEAEYLIEGKRSKQVLIQGTLIH